MARYLKAFLSNHFDSFLVAWLSIYLIKKLVITISIISMLVLGVNGATIVPVTGITGHDGGNWPSTFGHLTDMVNASNPTLILADATTGMTLVNPADPATWTWTSGSYQQTWHANSILSSTSSGKIGWVVMDFGSVVNDLENAYLWASSTGQTDSGKEQVQNYKIWYSNGVGINALPAMPNSRSTTGDYDFTTGDWTQVVGTNTLGQADGAVSNTIALGGISAQYIGIEVMSIYGVDDRMAIAQIEFTAASIPEPSAALLGVFGFLALLRRRR